MQNLQNLEKWKFSKRFKICKICKKRKLCKNLRVREDFPSPCLPSGVKKKACSSKTKVFRATYNIFQIPIATYVLIKYLYFFVASGRCLNFSSTMVLVLMLRYSLTRIRNLGLSTILPLDHHVYLHKLTGVVILVLAWIHTLSHLINFGVNVQPDPVKFVQLNNDYWVEGGRHRRERASTKRHIIS